MRLVEDECAAVRIEEHLRRQPATQPVVGVVRGLHHEIPLRVRVGRYEYVRLAAPRDVVRIHHPPLLAGLEQPADLIAGGRSPRSHPAPVGGDIVHQRSFDGGQQRVHERPETRLARGVHRHEGLVAWEIAHHVTRSKLDCGRYLKFISCHK
jgi:hypothetical protein